MGKDEGPEGYAAENGAVQKARVRQCTQFEKSDWLWQ